jgi:uncharacterized RDD family membrane protein YckC
MTYAGFWPRLCAGLIDGMFVSILEGLLALPLIVIAMVAPVISVITCLVTAVAGGAYFVLFESSRFQATPGKIAFGLKVTDLSGERISIKRGVLKIVAQYFLYALIVLAALVSDALMFAPELKSAFHPVNSSNDLIPAVWAGLAPILIGNLLYFACFFFCCLAIASRRFLTS